MKMRATLFSLCLVGLAGCQFTEQFFDWLDNASLVCDDIQSTADECWANADDEEEASECENLDWQAANCSWEFNGQAEPEEDDEAAEATEEDACQDLEDYADACWEWAETEEDEADCEEIEAELDACLEDDEEEEEEDEA